MNRIMVVEDDALLAVEVQSVLEDAGYEVVGIAATVGEAIALAEESQCEMGTFDMRLAEGGLGTEAAAAIRRRRRIGVLYSTGSPDHPRLHTAEGEGFLAKPYRAATLLQALRVVQCRMQGLPPALPLPAGFRMLPLGEPEDEGTEPQAPG